MGECRGGVGRVFRGLEDCGAAGGDGADEGAEGELDGEVVGAVGEVRMLAKMGFRLGGSGGRVMGKKTACLPND